MLTVVSSSTESALHTRLDKNGSLHVPESGLVSTLGAFRNQECYYSMFSFDESLRKQDYAAGAFTLKGYRGAHKCTLDYVVFDFDSSNDLKKARADAEKLLSDAACSGAIYFSGSKGYHLYVPTGALGPEFVADQNPSAALQTIAADLRKAYPTLDASIYDLQRKLRAPGSIHPKTKKLKTYANPTLALDSDGLFPALLPIESPLLADLYRKYKVTASAPQLESGFGEEDSAFIKRLKAQKHKPCISKMLNQTYGEGSRHKAMLIIVSDLHHQGFKGSAIREEMREWMLMNGLGGRDGELTAAIRQMEQGATYIYGCKESLRAEQCSARCPLFPELGGATLASRDGMPEDATPAQIEAANQKSAAQRIKKAAISLLRDRNLIYHVEQGEFYEFRETHFIRVPESEIDSFFEAHYTDMATNKNVKEFTGTLKRRVSVRADYFTKAFTTHINFKNGHFNKESGTLEARDHSRPFLYCLDFDYSDASECPAWDQFISQVFHDKVAGAPDSSLIQLTHEYIGYTLSGDSQWLQKIYIAHGEHGANGKSALFSLVRSMMSPGSVSSLSLEHLAKLENRPRVEGKLANINSEENSKSLLRGTETLKLFTTDDSIEARPLFESSYEFVSVAKLWVGCNALPDHNDQSNALYRRAVIANFNNIFDDEPETVDVPNGKAFKRDPFIGQKLLAERAGIFSRAWRAYQECKKRGRLVPSEAVKKAIAEYRADSDVIGSIIEKLVEPGLSVDHVLNRDLMFEFMQEAEIYGHTMKNVHLKTILATVKRKFKVSSIRVGKDGDRGYSGIKLRTPGAVDAGKGHDNGGKAAHAF